MKSDASAVPSISGSLAKIREITNYQKTLYDDLSRKIQQIDERLVELNFGVESRVEVTASEDGAGNNGNPVPPGFTDFVGFHRGPKGWHLHYLRQNNEKKMAYHQLLSEARKDFQLRAIKHLPRLIEQIALETEHKTDEIRNSLDIAEIIVDSLK